MRLGHACLTLGMDEPSMRAAQLGRWRRGLVELEPIYRHNVRYAERSIAYAARHGLQAFRISSDTFPLLDCDPELRRLVPSLASVRRSIAESGVHVSTHPGQFVVLSTPHADVLQSSLRVLDDMAWMMKRIGAAGSITLHGGGVYADREATTARLAANVERLSPQVLRHLALENDERCWTVPELLEATRGKVPIVFDKLHWQANPRSAPYETELEAALATWPEGRLPELHYSEQAVGKPRGAHAEHITGRGLLEFLEEVSVAANGRDCVVIVEAKRKDLAIACAIGELDRRRRGRLFELVPSLASAPRDWIERARQIESGATSFGARRRRAGASSSA